MRLWLGRRFAGRAPGRGAPLRPFGDDDESEEDDGVAGFAVLALFELFGLAGRTGLAPGAGFSAALAVFVVALAPAVTVLGPLGWYL